MPDRGRRLLEVVTGRALGEAALREPMRAIGWQPSAAGWFTRQVCFGFLGVAALGSASKYSRPGTAQIMLHVGIRDEATELVVSQLCGLKDVGYRQRTATIGIGYLLPGSSWREWEITPGNAGELARQLAALVQRYADPWLDRLSADRARILRCRQALCGLYPGSRSLPGPAVLLARHQGRGEAIAFLRERVDGLGTRTDLAAGQERELAARVRTWLKDP